MPESLSLFVICLLIFAVGMALFLAAKLLRSYPLVFFGALFVVTASVLAILDDKADLVKIGVFWLVFTAIAVITAGLHFLANKRGAFWWSFGAYLAMIVAAIPYDGMFGTPNMDELVAFAAPVLVFLLVGLFGSLLFPRLKYKDKNERKRITNTDTLIGKRVTICKEKDGVKSQRGLIGDVDWAVEPLYGYEKFKVGDVVKVHKIKGVTLLCTRDGKDLRGELREKHREQMKIRAAAAAEARAKRKAIQDAQRLERERERVKREEEKTQAFIAAQKAKEERLEKKQKQEAELKKIHEELAAAKKARADAMMAQKEAEKAKKEAEKARKAQEAAEKARKEAEEAAKAKKEAEKAAPVAKEKAPEKVSKQKAPKVKKEKAPKVKKEKAPKPKKESKFIKFVKECRNEQFGLLYIILSIIVFVFSVVIIVLAIIYRTQIKWLFIVFFALVLVYLLTLFICELLKDKKAKPVKDKVVVKKVEKKVEEPKKEEKVEEPKEEPAKSEKAEFIPFVVRLKQSDDFAKQAYNELKSEVLSYGIKSRVSSTGDTFRLHTKEYVKMVVAGKYLKLYLALDPKDYKDTTYPIEDASRMSAHKDTPLVFKIKSGLSVRRAKVLINDAAKKDNIEQGEVVLQDHLKDLN